VPALSPLMLHRFLLVVMLLGAAPPVQPAPAPRAITVYAAASLKESLDAVAEQWTQRSGQRVRISYAASSLLARQIAQGAPADLMISADIEWMDWLQARALIDPATRHDLLRNSLVVITPAGSPQAPFELSCRQCWLTALDDRRLAIADPESVPAGRYARQALGALGVWSGLQERLARADNVRAALAFVALAELPLGIVYRTDALAEPRVRVLGTIDPRLHAPIVYPVARLSSDQAGASAEFQAFLAGPVATRIFVRAGFDGLDPGPHDVYR
jgi:molybdate transport system substrate-binding protein